MTSTLLLRSLAERSDSLPADAMEPPPADSRRALWAGLVLAVALLSTGCASLTPPPGRGMSLRYTPLEVAAPASAEEPSVEPPRALASPPPAQPSLSPRRRSDSTVAGAPVRP
ncbi:hypothetical protein [Vitiosangium sp. GDMCC 1.1324]|uniref:hypothetical protein n=1 Tax=Vitiosangium sp. (strain GDMCC 1.1324) TaxID=2138576 RepID=UPI001E3B5540|nr:hypothetical protein [Vitiosangium sp. GDMCC 1.1324]